MGSPRYMSPEQARGVEVGPPSDVFSLRVMIYELLAGTAPFKGTTVMETMAAIMRDQPRPLRELALVPQPLAELVHACLDKDPLRRPTAAAVAESLASLDPGPAPSRLRPRWWMYGLALLTVAAVVGLLLAQSQH